MPPARFPVRETSREPLSRILMELRESGEDGSVVVTRTMPGRKGAAVPFPEDLHTAVVTRLNAAGISSLYTHQRKVWDLVAGGRDVVMATPTASGKSLAFNLPVFDRLCRCADATALYLYPTKALARDQLSALRALWPGEEREVDVYDGDTAQKQRGKVRAGCRLLVTNPDMLHTALLPHHPSWRRFFSGLSHVVIDEIHQYRGVIGSHAANVFRRMLRICGFYGSRPTFIGASATVANPEEVMAQLTRTDPEAVVESGAPSGKREFVFFNPPVVDAESGLREGSRRETVRLVMPFIRSGRRVIIFARSRKETEVILSCLRESLEREGFPPEAARSYRGGHLAAERRAVEEDLREGRVAAVVATTALELGIDIGGLDVAALAGYPGSIAGMWQQAGRAGRESDESVCILVAENTPLDQFIVTHPDYFFGQPPERAALDPANPHVLSSHLACAAFELPLSESELGPFERRLLDGLAGEGNVHLSDGRWHWIGAGYPAAETGLRSAMTGGVTLFDTSGEVIGVVEASGAPILVHRGAVYLHGGRSYVVEELDRSAGRALLTPRETDYLTEPLLRFSVSEESAAARKREGRLTVRLVPLTMTTAVTGFRRIRLFSHEYLDEEQIEPVESTLSTMGCAVNISSVTPDPSPPLLQAASYLLARVAPLYVFSDGRDIGSTWRIEDGQRATVYLYDRCPGGGGYGQRVYEACREILESAAEVAGSCRCPRGCPSCLGPRPLSTGERRAAAVDLLRKTADAAAGRSHD